MTRLLYSVAATIHTFDFFVLCSGLFLAGAGLLLLESKEHAIALILSSLVAFGLSHVLKLFFAVPRLHSAMLGGTGYRFPSQHALVASTFFGSLFFSALYILNSPYQKILVAAIALSAIVVTAWSRVFLGVHLLVDVIVGSLLGVGISLAVHSIIL